MPGPRSSHNERSMPGSIENGPSLATCAMLTRHAKPPANVAPAGSMAIWRVRPPPFAQACSGCSANGMRSSFNDSAM